MVTSLSGFSKKWIMGNWKMNGSLEALTLWRAFLSTHHNLKDSQAWETVVIFPPAPYIALMQDFPFALGGQGCSSFSQSGAYTQQISADMIHDVGAEFVLLGHSEIRKASRVTPSDIKAQISAAWSANLSVVLCCGDTCPGTPYDDAVAQVAEDIQACLPTLKTWKVSRPPLFIAYEPLWAIGATSVDPKALAPRHHALKRFLQQTYGDIPLVYGGAVDQHVIQDFLQDPYLEGVLVGRASLDPLSFSSLISLRNSL